MGGGKKRQTQKKMISDSVFITLFVLVFLLALSGLIVAVCAQLKPTPSKEEVILTVSSAGDFLYKKAHNAGVSVFTTKQNNQVVIGSGFVLTVDDSRKLVIVTAAHVVLDAVEINIVISGVEGSQNLQILCDLVGMDKAADVAVLTTQSDLAFSSNTQSVLQWQLTSEIGQTVYVMGNPLGNDFASVADGTLRDNKYVPTYNSGSIESVYISAPTTAGNSGGPVLDCEGGVIGLSNWVALSDENIPLSNFCGGVNSFMASKIVDRIIRGTNNRGYLGLANIQVVAGVVMLQLRADFPAFAASGFDIVQGVMIESLDDSNVDIPDSRCINAGLLAGDIIVSLNSVNIGVFENQFSPTRVSWFTAPGTSIPATIVRPSNGSLFSVNIILDTFPAERDTVLTTYC